VALATGLDVHTVEDALPLQQCGGGRTPHAGRGMDRSVSKATARSGKATRNMGHGLMQVAHAADDAQYGMRGVMNNIPGLVMGLGGSMGIAGAASIAVLALVKLHGWLKKIYSAEGMIAEAEERATKSMERRAKAAEKAGAAVEWLAGRYEDFGQRVSVVEGLDDSILARRRRAEDLASQGAKPMDRLAQSHFREQQDAAIRVDRMKSRRNDVVREQAEVGGKITSAQDQIREARATGASSVEMEEQLEALKVRYDELAKSWLEWTERISDADRLTRELTTAQEFEVAALESQINATEKAKDAEDDLERSRQRGARAAKEMTDKIRTALDRVQRESGARGSASTRISDLASGGTAGADRAGRARALAAELGVSPEVAANILQMEDDIAAAEAFESSGGHMNDLAKEERDKVRRGRKILREGEGNESVTAAQKALAAKDAQQQAVIQTAEWMAKLGAKFLGKGADPVEEIRDILEGMHSA